MPAVALTFAVTVGCGPGAGHAKPMDVPPLSRTPPPASPWPKIPSVPAWTYWQPVEAPILSGVAAATDLPVSATDLSRTPAALQRWDDAPATVRDAILTRGFAVVRPAHPDTRLGAFYSALIDDQVPSVVTLDALFFLAHLAFDRALADVDAHVLTPLAGTMLHRIDARLAAESRGVHADLAEGYSVARRIVAVALSLAEPQYVVAPVFAGAVSAERALVIAHAGVRASPSLGVAIDYSAMATEGVVEGNDRLEGWFRAVAWLENAWLALEGNGERSAHARADVATARVHTRAALLLSRALDGVVDPEAANAWVGIERSSALLVGRSDDVSPRDLAAAVASSELDLASTGWFDDVSLVDRVRHRAARGSMAPAFRLFGLRSTPDTEVLQSLTYPMVGRTDLSDATITWAPHAQAEPPFTARDGIRALPTGLDIAAWLGSAEARSALRDTGDDAYQGYDDTLSLLRHARPPDGPLASAGRHGTAYLSMIDAIETWLGPSAGDGCQPGSVTSDWRKRKADVALGAWTELRHDATALTRIPTDAVALAPRSIVGAASPIFVEAHPEAIAKLAGFVRQTSRALSAEGLLPDGAPALVLLSEVDDLLWTALGAAVYETADTPLPESLVESLANFPARVRDLETALADSGAADVPLAVGVHVDLPSNRVLEEATGRIDEAWMVVREPETHRLWLALGASIPHDELVQPASRRLSDVAWRAHFEADGDPAPGVLARWYVEP